MDCHRPCDTELVFQSFEWSIVISSWKFKDDNLFGFVIQSIFRCYSQLNWWKSLTFLNLSYLFAEFAWFIITSADRVQVVLSHCLHNLSWSHENFHLSICDQEWVPFLLESTQINEIPFNLWDIQSWIREFELCIPYSFHLAGLIVVKKDRTIWIHQVVKPFPLRAQMETTSTIHNLRFTDIRIHHIHDFCIFCFFSQIFCIQSFLYLSLFSLHNSSSSSAQASYNGGKIWFHFHLSPSQNSTSSSPSSWIPSCQQAWHSWPHLLNELVSQLPSEILSSSR